MEKKAQTALEYLMTYGWAILIIIIVGAALYALGVFSPGTFTGKRSTGFSGFQLNDFKVNTTPAINLSFGDRVGRSINLTNITLTFKGTNCSFNAATATNSTPIPGVIGPNAAYTVTIPCSVWGTQTLKTSYTIAVDFNYKDADSGFTHTDSGTIFGVIE